MLGNLVYEGSGKVTGTRVLPDGRLEQSNQITGKFWGVEGVDFDTAVATPRSDGTFSFELVGLFNSTAGDAAQFNARGIGWFSGPGKTSLRGAATYWTQAQKLAAANKVLGVFEGEVDENGNIRVKAWEWK